MIHFFFLFHLLSNVINLSLIPQLLTCRVNVLLILELSRVKVKQIVTGINNATRYFPAHFGLNTVSAN